MHAIQQKGIQQIKDQVAILRQSEQPGQWILAVQMDNILTYQGSGNNGFTEFKHFLLPDIIAHIYYLLDKPDLPLLHQKQQCRAVLISWIGTQSNIRDTNKLMQQINFQEVFQPIYGHIITQDIDKMISTIQQMSQQTPQNPSFKQILESIDGGFIVYGNKERKLQPHILTNVTARTIQKQGILQTSGTDVNGQMGEFLFGKGAYQQPSQQRLKQQLVRANPKISQQVQQLQKKLTQMQIQNEQIKQDVMKKAVMKAPKVNIHQSILSTYLEDDDVDMIQDLITSIQPIHDIDNMLEIPSPSQQKQQLPQGSQKRSNSVVDGSPSRHSASPSKISKNDKITSKQMSSLPTQKSKSPELQLVSNTSPQKAVEEKDKTKIDQLKSISMQINDLTPYFQDQKLQQQQKLLQQALTDFIGTYDVEQAKAVKIALNKTAMSFLIIEAGKRGVMKKDFSQTLVAIKPFLPEGGDAVLKKMIQGTNQTISPDEAVQQVNQWANMLTKYFVVK